MRLKRVMLRIVMAGVVLLGWGWLGTGEAQSDAVQSVRGGGVTVRVELLKGGGDAATFKVALNTHTVNLDDYSFEEIVRLRDGQGGELVPTAVEGAEGGGHHRRATLRFAWPEPKPESLELVVKGVAGVTERVFRWTIE